jgi:hypothetical protein
MQVNVVSRVIYAVKIGYEIRPNDDSMRLVDQLNMMYGSCDEKYLKTEATFIKFMKLEAKLSRTSIVFSCMLCFCAVNAESALSKAGPLINAFAVWIAVVLVQQLREWAAQQHLTNTLLRTKMSEVSSCLCFINIPQSSSFYWDYSYQSLPCTWVPLM